tara:strand:- start:27936 stop:28472 length:537 start_codon:yes stop_codon:yes gene_type:complete
MESTDQAPPASFERQLSPQEERDVLINFMGNVYGETKKLDGNVIGASTTLSNNKSDEIKQHIEKLVSQPHPVIPQQLPPQHAEPIATVPAPHVAESRVEVVPVQQPQAHVLAVDPDQLTFSFDVNEKEELFKLVDQMLTKLDKLHRKVDDVAAQVAELSVVKKKSTGRKKAASTKKET